MKSPLLWVGLLGGLLVIAVGTLWGARLYDLYLSTSAEYRVVWWIGTLAVIGLILVVDQKMRRQRF